MSHVLVKNGVPEPDYLGSNPALLLSSYVTLDRLLLRALVTIMLIS